MRSIRFAHALRWLLFITIGWWATAQPGEPLVTMGAPQTVITRNPKAGVHTRLTDEAAAWKIQRTFQMVREMGASWVVEFFPWAYIEPGQNAFDWSHADQAIDHARAQGLTLPHVEVSLAAAFECGQAGPPSSLLNVYF